MPPVLRRKRHHPQLRPLSAAVSGFRLRPNEAQDYGGRSDRRYVRALSPNWMPGAVSKGRHPNRGQNARSIGLSVAADSDSAEGWPMRSPGRGNHRFGLDGRAERKNVRSHDLCCRRSKRADACKSGAIWATYSSALPTIQAVLAGLRPEDVVEIDEVIRSAADLADGAKAGYSKMIDLELPRAAGAVLVEHLVDQASAGPNLSAGL